MKKNIFGLLFSFLIISLVSFASFGGGGGGPPTPPKPTPDIFITGACTNQEVSVAASLNGAPAADATIEVSRLASGSSPTSVATGTTDSSGVFKFTPNTAADYDAVVSGNTIQSIGKVFTITNCAPKPNIETPNNNSGINFQCTQFETMKERIACRINLPEDQAQNNLLFLPEECRVLNGTDRDNCIKTYSVIQQCRHLFTDKDRDSCYFNEVANLSNIPALRTACANNSACLDNLRAEVYGFVKFRIYNLEEKSEKLWGKGYLSQTETVSFIEGLEIKKQAFNNATTVDDKIAVIKQMQQDWITLKGTVLLRILGG